MLIPKDEAYMKYSELKMSINSHLEEKSDEEFAYFTHYLQNSEEYSGGFVKSPTAKPLANFYQPPLPLKWDVPFPPHSVLSYTDNIIET
ncbi:MAG: hypothetical protein Ta2A_19780 [Treponemataceae bacterium]|nr:MAG: hypothetical protein Ta2A_19780 [Treponemataceae bacterium]